MRTKKIGRKKRSVWKIFLLGCAPKRRGSKCKTRILHSGICKLHLAKVLWRYPRLTPKILELPLFSIDRVSSPTMGATTPLLENDYWLLTRCLLHPLVRISMTLSCSLMLPKDEICKYSKDTLRKKHLYISPITIITPSYRKLSLKKTYGDNS